MKLLTVFLALALSAWAGSPLDVINGTWIVTGATSGAGVLPPIVMSLQPVQLAGTNGGTFIGRMEQSGQSVAWPITGVFYISPGATTLFVRIEVHPPADRVAYWYAQIQMDGDGNALLGLNPAYIRGNPVYAPIAGDVPTPNAPPPTAVGGPSTWSAVKFKAQPIYDPNMSITIPANRVDLLTQALERLDTSIRSMQAQLTSVVPAAPVVPEP